MRVIHLFFDALLQNRLDCEVLHGQMFVQEFQTRQVTVQLSTPTLADMWVGESKQCVCVCLSVCLSVRVSEI